MMKLRMAGAACLMVLGVSAVCAQGTPPQGGTPPPQGNNPVNNQAGNTQDRVNAANQSIFGRVNQTAWFSDQAMRNQLKINEDQAKRLNDSYKQFWTVYHRNTEPFNNSFTLSDGQRQNLISASNQFYVDFGRSANDILTPEQRVRFFQIGNQYQGYGALYAPTISERLRLSADQLTQLRRFENDYNTRLADYYKVRTVDPTTSAMRFEEILKERNERITSVLNEEQRQAWKEIVGEPYRWRIE
jgi:hypothetical protein